MQATTIKIQQATKSKLDKFRESKNESYDEVIQKVVYIAQKSATEPKLSKKTILEIEKARERIKKGEYYTMEEMKKRLGI